MESLPKLNPVHYNHTGACLDIEDGFFMTEFDKYVSPYTWRYGSPEMREIWGEIHTRLIWRRIWVALAEVQMEHGLTQKKQVQDLILHRDDVDIARAIEIENQNHHDLMAEVETYAEQCPVGGGIIHLGATSVDIKDNATALQIRDSIDLIIIKLRELLVNFASKINQYADLPIIAFTHLQPAEPSTLGYRLSQYGQDLLEDWDTLQQVRASVKGKGFKGAVGTSASYAELVGSENLPRFEALLSEKLDLDFYEVTTQTYPRKQDFKVLSTLAGMGASIYKFAFDLRILQSPPIGELAEPFGDTQVGSSAMPFKRNPINAEKINSLARMLAQYPRTAWDNAAHSLLERTLDDSANRRSLLPEAFLISDELLRVAIKITRNFIVDEDAIARNLAAYGPFAATERLLMALGKAGANRQEMHRLLRVHSLVAWESIRKEGPNPLVDLVSTDPDLLKYLPQREILALMDASQYIGDAPKRARLLALHIKQQI
jgi:adenylosuccinate lyase